MRKFEPFDSRNARVLKWDSTTFQNFEEKFKISSPFQADERKPHSSFVNNPKKDFLTVIQTSDQESQHFFNNTNK